MGLQSFAMYLMSSVGVMNRFDYSIFVDLGDEKEETYKHVEWLKVWASENNGIPIIHVSNRNLKEESLGAIGNGSKRFVSIPFFSSGVSEREGMLRRQCTSEFKIRQVLSAIKSLYGKSGNARFPETYVYLGITIDEMQRMARPEPVRFTNVYPFCDYMTGYRQGSPGFVIRTGLPNVLSRNQCEKWLVDNDFPVPPKSSCVFCPYTSNAEWQDLKVNAPDDFKKAVQFDSDMRNAKPGKLRSKLFLHRSLKPLDKVDLTSSGSCQSFECSGYCHV